MTTKSIFWFRKDLRLRDNPGLSEAVKNGEVLPIYILDDVNAGEWGLGGASKVWLYHSLKALNDSLGEGLHVYKGNPLDVLSQLIKTLDIKKIYWNRQYEPWAIERDKKLKAKLSCDVMSYNGSLIWEPWEIKKGDGGQYKVFTPFYKACLSVGAQRAPLPLPKNVSYIKDPKNSMTIDDLNLLPKLSWPDEMMESWKVGEKNAEKTLKKFLSSTVNSYKEGRDFPAINATSKLSPHLSFGEISPVYIWDEVFKQGEGSGESHFLRELCWREFSYHLLYYAPTLPHQNFNPKFNKYPWKKNTKALSAWKEAQTGYPIIDAGLRELWETGYMHNRVRMIVASFLVKNLQIHWKEGEKWFWDCLVDADLANNSASWQWVAGSGADAAPYFRIFNPVTQSKKFDPEGEYIKRYLPELENLSSKHIHDPSNAPDEALRASGVHLGVDYPRAIVDLKVSRQKALDDYQLM